MLLDPETFALAPGVERLLGPAGLKTELFSCLVETNTPVCETAAEAHAELVRLRRLVRGARGARGPRRRGGGVASVLAARGAGDRARAALPEDARGAGPIARGQLVCGLHVHVGMESFDALPARRSTAILPWLPAVLALSAQLAVPRGRGDGCALAARRRLRRAARVRRAAACSGRGGRGRRSRGGRRRLHADLVGRTAASAARDARGADRRPADERRPRGGARGARAGALRCPRRRRSQALCLERRGRARPGADDELLALVEPAARELGTWELVEKLRAPPEALRQLEIGRRDGLDGGRRRPGGARPLRRRSARRSTRSGSSRARLGRRSAPGRPRRARDRRGRRRSSSAAARGRRRAGPRRRAGDRADPGGLPLGPGGLVRHARPGDEPQPRARAPRPRARSRRAGAGEPTSLVLFRETTIAGTFAGLGGVEGLGALGDAPLAAGCRGRARRSAARCCGCAATGRLPRTGGAAPRRGRQGRARTTGSSSATSSRRPTTRSRTPR